ncbi:MAG: hypothetical protein V1721_07390 [Pseudomonadota bacterium]
MKDFCKEAYINEMCRRDEIISSLQIPIGAVTVFVSSVFYFSINMGINIQHIGLIDFIFIQSVVACFISSIISVWNIGKSAHGQFYEYLENPETIYNHLLKLEEYHAKEGAAEKDKETLARSDFEKYLLEKRVQCANTNYENNYRKSIYRDRAYAFLTYAFFSLLVSGSLFIIKNVTMASAPPSFSIIYIGENTEFKYVTR